MPLPSFSAGQILVAADLQALSTYLTRSVDTAPGTIGPNFTSALSHAVTVMGGRQIFLDLIITSTNAIVQTNSNIADTLCYTLNSAYWPTNDTGFSFGNGNGQGEGVITASNGQMTIRSFDGGTSGGVGIAAASNLRIFTAYMLETA